MANDATTQIPQGSHEADTAGTAHDGDYAAVQVAEATPAAAPAPSPSTPADGKVVNVEVPQGGTVVRVPVQAGETVILPPPFDAHHDLAAKEGNGNLAIKVGDVTVILQGYIDAANDPQHPVTVEGSDHQPVDIAVVLASTDPNLDIQTAAGPAAGTQGADNTGAILAALAGGAGLGGLNAVGVLDQTELQYKLIDNSIRKEIGPQQPENAPGGPLTIGVVNPHDALHQSFLHDPVVTYGQLKDNLSFDTFLHGLSGSGQESYSGFDNSQADFDGTQSKPGSESEHAIGQILVDPSNSTTVDVTLTTTAIAGEHLTSDGIELQYQVSDDGKTIFGFRGDGTGGSDGALVLVVHVGDPTTGDGTVQQFPVDYYLVNRLDDTTGDGTQIDLTVSFDVHTGDDRSISGTISETVLDDNPIAVADSYDVKNNDGIVVNSTDGVEHNDNFGADGKLGATLSVPGDGGVVGVENTLHVQGTLTGDTYSVAGEFGTLHLKEDGSFTYDRTDTGPTKGDEVENFTYTIEDDDGDKTTTTLTLHINDHPVIITPPNEPPLTPPPPGSPPDTPPTPPQDLKVFTPGTVVYESGLSTGSSPDATKITTGNTITVDAKDGVDTITIDGHTVAKDGSSTTITGAYGDLTVHVDTKTGDLDYSYTLTSNDPHNSGQGNDIALGEDFKIEVHDTDGDKGTGDLYINIVDDVPTAKADTDEVTFNAGSTTSGNVVTGVGDATSHLVADTKGADQPATLTAITNSHNTAGASDGKGGFDITGDYGTLHINSDGSYKYTVGPNGIAQGKDDVFHYTLTDSDGDNSTTTLTIDTTTKPDITPETPAGHPGEVDVYEAGLAIGSHPGNAADPIVATGSFLIDSHGEGFQSLTVGGKDISLTNFTTAVNIIDDATGTLKVTGVVDKGNGAYDVTYEYDLKAPVHDAAGADSLTLPPVSIVATDTSGDPATSQITVKIVDDVPTANADTDQVTYTAGSTTSGNVVTGAGDATSHLVADTKGADQPATLTAITNSHNAAGASDGKGGFDITGDYGTLHINSDGSYKYTVGPNGIAQGKDDVFHYTLTDSDGDSSTTTLTIDTTTKPDITQETPAGHPGEVDVYEAGLAIGSHPGNAADPIVATGTFLVDSHGEGFQSLTVGGKDVSLTNFTTAVDVIDDATGTLKVTGVVDKGNGAYEVTYEYDLKAPVNDAPGANDLTLPPVSIVATDTSGDPATSSLTVKIVDDVPTANMDTDTVNVAAASTTSGNVITGVPAAGNTDSHLQADVSGADRFKAAGDAAGGQAHISSIVHGATTVTVPSTGNTASIVGDHGTLVIDDHGNYTYTVDKNGLTQGETDQFTYTLVDADGDTSTTTLTIDVNCPTITQNTPDSPGSTPGHVDVYEAGLPDGSKDGPTATVSHGSFAIDSHGEGFSSLTVGGQQVNLDNFKAVTINDAHGSMEITGVQTDGKGDYTLNYQYTLNSNIIDNTAAQDGHNTVNGQPTYSIVATDKSGDIATSSLSVDVVDDVPLAKDSTKSITATSGNYNVMLTIDVSGSMNDSSGVAKPDGTGTYTKLELEKAAISDLLATYQAQGDVSVHINWFNEAGSGGPNDQGDASNPGVGSNEGGWMSVSEAIAYVNGLVAQGQTNYDIAINQAEQSFADKTGYIAGGTNVSYFFSDGMPNANDGPGSDNKDGISNNPADKANPTQLSDWEAFLDTNDVNSYAIGVGGAAVTSALTPVAYDGTTATDPNGNTIVVTDLNQLSSVINQTVPTGTSGNLISSDLGGTFGADGGHIQTVTIGTETHTYDAANHSVTFTLANGTFVLDMSTGEYTFTPKLGVEQTEVDVSFKLVDGDGDLSGAATLHLVPTNHAPVISSNGAVDHAAIQVIEGATAVTTVHAVDIDVNSSVTYKISGGADAALFTIDTQTGELKFAGGHQLSNPQDSGKNNVYDVTVTATDNHGATDSQTIAVTIDAAAVAGADHIYTNQTGSVTVLDQFLLANDTDKDTPHDQLQVTNTGAPPSQQAYYDAFPAHGSDLHGSGWTTFNLDTGNSGTHLSSGGSTAFEYQVNDGAGDSALASVAVTYTTGATIDAHTQTANIILIGGAATGETFLAGSGNDVIVTGGADKNGVVDHVNGGAGFDQVAISGTSTWSTNYTNVEMANLHDGETGKLTINAADVIQQSAGTAGGKDVDLFVVGDHDATAKDSVALSGFSGAAVATNVSFTDAGTNTAHTYDLYQGTGTHTGVIVAVEHDLTVTVTP